MRTDKELRLIDRADWRSWLQKNHDTEKEVWLFFYKRQTGKQNISYNDAVEEAICFGWIDSIIKRVDDEKFTRKFTSRKAKSRWSELNKKRAERMMDEGKMTEAGLAIIREAKNNGEWFRTPVKKEFVIPLFVKEALKANNKALENFNSLTPSYRRQFVGWIASAKKVETRKRRLAEAIRLLVKNEKLGMR